MFTPNYIKEIEEKFDKDIVTISRTEFLKISARILSDDNAMRELIHAEPALLLAFGMFTAAVSKKIFGEED